MKDHPQSLVWAAITRFIVVALFFDALAPLFPYMADSHHLSDRQFQLLIGTCYVVFAFSQLSSAPVIAVLGMYRSVAASCIGLTMASILLCLADSAALFATLLVAMFACNSIGSNATRVALREVSSDSGFKRLIAWASSAVEIKQIAMPFIAGSIVVVLGWRWALIVLVAPVMLVGVWIGYAGRGRKMAVSTADVAASGWREIASMPAFFIPTLIAASFQLAFSPLSARLPFILSGDAGMTPVTMGLALSGASAVVAVGLFISGWLAPRPYWSSRRLIWFGWIIVCVGLLCLLGSKSGGVNYAIVGIVIVQSAFGFIVIPCAADAMDACKSNRIKASALFGFIQPLIGGFSVLLTGAMNTSNVDVSIVMTVVSLLLLLVLWAIRRRKTATMQ